MTDTNTLAPTDADIIALADKTRTGEPGRDGYILPISFARAVLAKWGTPTPASQPVAAPEGMEPVAWVEVRPGLDGWFLAYNFNPDAQTEPLYSGFQVQAMLAAAPSGTAWEPLSQERLHFLSGEYEDIPEEGVAFRDGWRSAEMHHGITAAQVGWCKDCNPDNCGGCATTS